MKIEMKYFVMKLVSKYEVDELIHGLAEYKFNRRDNPIFHEISGSELGEIILESLNHD